MSSLPLALAVLAALLGTAVWAARLRLDAPPRQRRALALVTASGLLPLLSPSLFVMALVMAWGSTPAQDLVFRGVAILALGVPVPLSLWAFVSLMTARSRWAPTALLPPALLALLLVGPALLDAP